MVIIKRKNNNNKRKKEEAEKITIKESDGFTNKIKTQRV